MGTGLSPKQKQILIFIEKKQPQAQREIMAVYGIGKKTSSKSPEYKSAKASLSRSLERLRNRGLLTGYENWMKLTEEGRKEIEKIKKKR